MKEFFKSPKAIFIGIALLLNLGSLALVFANKIEFGTFIGSISAISAGVFGLYQFYSKDAIVKEAQSIIKQYNGAYNIVIKQLDTLKNKNNSLKERINVLTAVSENNATAEKVKVDNTSELVEPKEVKPKRKYTKRKTTKKA